VNLHHIVCLTTGPYPLPKRILHTVRSSASSFNFQCPLVSLRSSRTCLCLLLRLAVTYILPSIFPSGACFRRRFLRKMWPIKLAVLGSLWYFFFHFLCNSSNWSSPSFSSTTFQNFQVISDLLFEVSSFHHHTKLSSKCSISPVSSLNLGSICWLNEYPTTTLSFVKQKLGYEKR
jgi:hypothetical protein